MIELNLQQLVYVQKIAEAKSINKASRVLHVSQPALTKQLKSLENELKTILFNRNKNGVELTEDGELFLSEAGKILNQVDSLKQEFIKRQKKVLHIGALPSIATYLLPNVIKKMNDLGYQTNVMVLDTSDQIERLLLQGKINAGFGQDVNESDYLYPILIEPYYAIVPSSSILANAQSISICELSNETMILPSLPCDIRKSFDNYLNQQEIIMKSIIEVGQNEPILSLVKTGIGMTVFPEMTINDLDRNVKAVPLKNKDFGRL